MIPFIIAGAAMGAGFVIGTKIAEASGPFIQDQFNNFVKGCDDFAKGFDYSEFGIHPSDYTEEDKTEGEKKCKGDCGCKKPKEEKTVLMEEEEPIPPCARKESEGTSKDI